MSNWLPLPIKSVKRVTEYRPPESYLTTSAQHTIIALSLWGLGVEQLTEQKVYLSQTHILSETEKIITAV